MKARTITGFIWVLLFIIFTFYFSSYFQFLAGIFMVVSSYEIFNVMKNKKQSYGVYLLTLLYLLMILFSIFMWNLFVVEDAKLFFLIILLTWNNDTFALLTGMFLGKTKLSPHLSPSKTLEGSLGGIIFGVLISYVYIYFLNLDLLTNIYLITILVLVSIVGQLGDLFESIFKRTYEVKDSGTIIYGHGGLLDRIDSMVFTLPLGYILFSIINIL